jgi:hypothetical protein
LKSLNTIKSNISFGQSTNTAKASSTANNIKSNVSNDISYGKTVLLPETKTQSNDDVLERMRNKLHDSSHGTKSNSRNSGSKKMIK